ncbi:Uncharacterized protein TCM_000129 [Theobroma cacao]|uniref:Uncharacterized protein n=1 Tax=Theobroma cacao TaxID=3641 RepID=A0A061DGF1_THECC|nr:Uncharacterized protein TCM_000129 [Theobroma cacao]
MTLALHRFPLGCSSNFQRFLKILGWVPLNLTFDEQCCITTKHSLGFYVTFFQ